MIRSRMIRSRIQECWIPGYAGIEVKHLEARFFCVCHCSYRSVCSDRRESGQKDFDQNYLKLKGERASCTRVKSKRSEEAKYQ